MTRPTRHGFTFLVTLLCAWEAALPAADPVVHLVAPTEALTPAEQKKMFHLPPGFEIQLVATEPDIHKPMNLHFDAAGRLYVTSSLEYPFGAKEGTKPRDTIQRIEDSNGDGVPDKVTTFADGLNIPIGVTSVVDGVLGYAIPNIYRFRDTDGDGKADQREIAYREFGSRDTHGMSSSYTWWLDGWVYACHGFANDSRVEGTDKQPISMNSGNTYRFRPDGSHIEYFTHGQVNPFGLGFDALGNVYSADCHSKPIYQLLRGAYYPSFGKPDDGLGFGPEMISHSHGSTGICGVVIYEDDKFPKKYHGTAFICNPVTGRINHDVLEPHGSTYRAVEQPDFVTCDDPWFRPVDIKLAADGSMYIADFYNCIIGHYEVPLTHPRRDRERGRIWRVVYRGENSKDGTARHAERDGYVTPAKASPAELVALLGHVNQVVRTQATHELVHRVGMDAAVRVKLAIHADSTALHRAHAVWVLERLGELDNNTIRILASDGDRIVRVHLLKALASRADWGGETDSLRTLVLTKLADDDAFVRRAAADALGLHPHRENISPLLSLWRNTQGFGAELRPIVDPKLRLRDPAVNDDTHLIHVTRMALRDNLAALKNYADFAQAAVEDRQMLADISLGNRTPESAAFVLEQIQQVPQDHRRLFDLTYHAARFGDADVPARTVAFLLSQRARWADGQAHALLRSLQRGFAERGQPLPANARGWAVEIASRQVRAKDDGTIRGGIDLARDLRLTETADQLAKLAQPDAPRAGLRQPALDTLVQLDAARAVPLLSRIVERGDEPLAARQKGADTLGGINSELSRQELVRLIRLVPEAVAVSIARGLSGSRDGADLLLVTITDGKASPRLLQDAVVDGKLKAANPPKLAERLLLLLKDLPAEGDKTKQLLAARLTGFQKAKPDLTRGAEVYTKICANCHRMNNAGAKVGPDLDGVGQRGLERLLEDTLAPNRNVDQAFRATVLALKDGKVVTGLLLREEGELLVIVNEQGKELRVPKSDVEERNQLKLSPMPANIVDQLPEADYFHLLGFLLSQRQAPPATKP
jgi:putative heme-binding domain-containing protein